MGPPRSYPTVVTLSDERTCYWKALWQQVHRLAQDDSERNFKCGNAATRRGRGIDTGGYSLVNSDGEFMRTANACILGVVVIGWLAPLWASGKKYSKGVGAGRRGR